MRGSTAAHVQWNLCGVDEYTFLPWPQSFTSKKCQSVHKSGVVGKVGEVMGAVSCHLPSPPQNDLEEGEENGKAMVGVEAVTATLQEDSDVVHWTH